MRMKTADAKQALRPLPALPPATNAAQITVGFVVALRQAIVTGEDIVVGALR